MAQQTKYIVAVHALNGGGASGTFLDADGWTDEIAVSFQKAVESVPFFAGKVTIEKIVTDSSEQVLDMTADPPEFK